jgi:hypothetical protein
MESVTIWMPLGEGERVVQGDSETSVQVWLWEEERTMPWTILAVTGTLPAMGSFSRYASTPCIRTCARCGETHEGRCRSRFYQSVLGGQTQYVTRCAEGNRCGYDARLRGVDNNRQVSNAGVGGRAGRSPTMHRA